MNCQLLLVGLLLFLPSASSFAAAEIRLRLNDIIGPDWHAQQVELAVAHDDGESAMTLKIGELQIDGWPSRYSALQLDCQTIESAPGSLECQSGQAEFDVGPADVRQTLKPVISFTLDWASGEVIRSVIQIDFNQISNDAIVPLLPKATAAALAEQINVTAGDLSGTVEISAGKDQPTSVSGSINLQKLAFSDDMGTRAGENLSARIEFSGDFNNDNLAFQVNTEFTGGDLFVNPLFFSWAETGPAISLRGRWSKAQQSLAFNGSYKHPKQFDLAGGAELFWPSGELEVLSAFGRIRVENLATTYQTYLQPWLVDTLAGDMQVVGKLSGRFSYLANRGITSLALQLQEIGLLDQQARFSVAGLSASLPWRGANQPSKGDMRWQSLQLYRLPFGHGSSRLQFEPASLNIEISPVALFDGGFAGGNVLIRGLGTEQLTLTMGGGLNPLSLPLLTKALGWPEMAGTLAADVPAIHYQQGRIELEGGVQVNVFDGELGLSNLVIDNLFGLVPRLSTDLRADNLDLAQLTHTFDFGGITGRVSGRVDNLRLEAWKPVAFDGWLQTPTDDPGPHKISQRALDSLSSIGGISGALQSTMLRFFDDFSYRRLGIGCQLAGGVCQMRGIADHGDGYYIVQGGGWWPRIDLVGYNRRVDWLVLLQRLKAATDVDQIEIR